MGGSKGGGKSYTVRAREMYRRLAHPNSKGLIVRKTHPELLANHIRPFFTEHPEVRDWYNKAEKTIYWPNGSTTEFSYLQNTDDVYTYQGREYEDITIDEITQHEEEVFKILRSSLRTSNKEFSKVAIPTMFLTGNPGGIGHNWVKRIFIDRQFTEQENPSDFVFIPAKVYDNQALLDADPDYVKRLMDLPIDKRRAYLDGDWDIFTGQVFSEFSRLKHVMRPMIPSVEFDHYLSMDWGYSENSAFAAYLHAVVKMKTKDGQNFQRVITYKEWYGNQKAPHEWAEIIYNDCDDLGIKPIKGYVDPAMLNTQTDGSKSIGKLMIDKWNQLNKDPWLLLAPGGKNRIARVATVHNWLLESGDRLPYWMITESCPNLIRTLPMLVYDQHKVDDVDTSGEDHAFDSIGYFLSEVKFIPVKTGTHTYRMTAEPIKKRYNEKNQEIGIDVNQFSAQYA